MEEKMFKSRKHWDAFTTLISRMQNSDVYHISVAYLLTLDEVTRKHYNELFDVDDDCIKRDGLNKDWQTGTSKKVTRLAFNLWNGCADDGKVYIDQDGFEQDLPSEKFSVAEIFCCNYMPYFYEAIKLRYPEYASEQE